MNNFEEALGKALEREDKLKAENKRLKESRQSRSTEFHQILDIIAIALGIQIGRSRWWDNSRKGRVKLLLSKIKALRYSKP